MADEKLSIEELQQKQTALQESFEHEQGKFQAARTKYANKKQALTDFNNKYGRMLKLVVVQAEQAEHLAEAEAEQKAQAEESTLTKTDDVEGPAVDEIVNDPPVDDTAEE